MSRRNAAPVRDVLPDPKYNSKVVTKLINQVMLNGDKGKAQGIVFDALEILQEKTGVGAMEALDKILENAMPLVETKARRLGGANYQVPVEIRPARRQTLAIRWIVNAARKRSERGMDTRLALELVDAFHNTGGAIKRKDEVHRMAEANKAFAHFNW